MPAFPIEDMLEGFSVRLVRPMSSALRSTSVSSIRSRAKRPGPTSGFLARTLASRRLANVAAS